MVLHAGQTASALLDSRDLPVVGMPTCPPALALVTVPGMARIAPSARVKVCGTEVDVSPFLLGFDGMNTGGEVVGTAPVCRSSAASEQVGPVVQVDAWSGTKLANLALVFASPTATTPYRLVLRPGSFRITAHGESYATDHRSLRFRVGSRSLWPVFGSAHPADDPG